MLSTAFDFLGCLKPSPLLENKLLASRSVFEMELIPAFLSFMYFPKNLAYLRMAASSLAFRLCSQESRVGGWGGESSRRLKSIVWHFVSKNFFLNLSI